MSYSVDKKTGEVTIAGFERGIASSPHTGIGDMKGLNISSMPGEVMVSYTRALNSFAVNTGSVTFNTSNTVVHAGSDVISGTAITISGSADGNIANGNYYATRISSTSFHLSSTYATFLAGTFITAAGNTSATFTVLQPAGQPISWAASDASVYPNYDYYIADGSYVWWSRPAGSGSFPGWRALDAQSGSIGATGVFCLGSYVLACLSGTSNALRYKPVGSTGTVWTNFQDLNNDSANNPPSHYHFCFLSQNGVVYIADGQYVDSLQIVPSATFDPTDSATYTWSTKALTIPVNDNVSVINELNNGADVSILIGGELNVIYVWDGQSANVAPNSGTFIFLPESYTQQMVAVNNLVYIFCGSKGNIYVTNGSSATSVMTVPDYIANNLGTNQDPYFIWGGAMYLRGRIYFSVKAPNCGGIWSFVPTINYYVTEDTGASLRMENQNSYANYSGYATLLFPLLGRTAQNANGPQYYAGWDSGSSTYGVDFSGTTPFIGGAIIETDLVPLGTMLAKETYEQIEYKLSAPLVAGESIQIYYRLNLTTAFATCGTVVLETTNPLSGYFSANFEKTQEIQLQVVLTSTNSSPSWCRLMAVFLR